jgi:hypothetical protein
LIERQTDRQSGEWKYLVRGQAIDSRLIATAAKLSVTDKLVIITVYWEK